MTEDLALTLLGRRELPEQALEALARNHAAMKERRSRYDGRDCRANVPAVGRLQHVGNVVSNGLRRRPSDQSGHVN